jgi:hypothetical protein
MPDDRYAEYYAAKLWHLIPVVYRSLDSDLTKPGPLAEIVNRIAAQAAVLRRSVDRLWEDQSIESCDDWIIPYIGDLVATRLVACLDARSQRLDVAKTIYYRRRKGTVGLLEELASDIAGRDARIVEFFRRLARTRHCFDPPVGLVPLPNTPDEDPPAAVVEGLVGAYTRTPAGGYADLRDRYGASKAHTAFDEYAHTADFRRGLQSVGWHNIPKLGGFLYWLKTYAVSPTTPVPYTAHPCPDQFTFDPTGREIPLFSASRRSGDCFGEAWVAPNEWQLAAPIDQLLFDRVPQHFYPDALAVIEGDPPTAVVPLSGAGLKAIVNVRRGRFRLAGGAPAGGVVSTRYHYGFASEIGAGGYDQRRGGTTRIEEPDPLAAVTGGADALKNALAGMAGASGTFVIEDSVTYTLPGTLGGAGGIDHVVIRGKYKERPVVRALDDPRPEWVIVGAPGAQLALQGIHLVGADLVLRGEFDSVLISCATLDPGTSGAALHPPGVFLQSVDGHPLAPTRLFVEARVKDLHIERAITGPLRTRNGGGIETLRVTDSILQSIPETEGGPFKAGDLSDPGLLLARLRKTGTPGPLAKFLRGALTPEGSDQVDAHKLTDASSAALTKKLTDDLNAILANPLYTKARFAQVHLSKATRALAAKPLAGADLIAFNRRLLAEAWPAVFAQLAIATISGTVDLSRTTVLGALAVHRLYASECILDGVAIAEDAQHGCIRFTTYAEGSVLHQPYESVTVLPDAALFRTREFGQPDYARLRDGVDEAITTGGAGASIVNGAENGSEVGAFCREQVPLKRRGLTQKFAEYMPVGLVPIWVDAT